MKMRPCGSGVLAGLAGDACDACEVGEAWEAMLAPLVVVLATLESTGVAAGLVAVPLLAGSGSSGVPTSAMSAPTRAEEPSGTRILRSTPLENDSISIVTL